MCGLRFCASELNVGSAILLLRAEVAMGLDFKNVDGSVDVAGFGAAGTRARGE
jgi:hypothetical protein